MGLGNIFKKDDKDEKSETARLGETIKNLSDKIYELQKQLNQRNSEIDQLTTQLTEAQRQAQSAKGAQSATEASLSSTTEVLKQAQARARELEQQIGELKKAETEAKALAEQVGAATTAAGGMAAGATAWVQKAGGKSLRRRSAPGLNSDVLDGLAPGTQLTLLEGPIDADGYSWWRIRAADGREGWVAGQELVTSPE